MGEGPEVRDSMAHSVRVIIKAECMGGVNKGIRRQTLTRYYGLSCAPPLNLYVEILTPNVTIFGNNAFKEVIKVK